MPDKQQIVDLSRRKDSAQVKFRHYTNIPSPDSQLNVVQSGCRFQANPGYKTRVNIYDHYIIHYITSGKGVYILDDIIYPVKQGDLFLIPPYSFNYYIADELEPYTYYWVGFNGLEAANLISLTAFNHHPVISDAGDSLGALFQALYELDHHPIALKYGLMGYLYTILSQLMAQVDKPLTKQNPHYLRAMDYITSNYQNSALSVQDIADQVGVTRAHLYRIFQKTTNNSINHSILGIRLSKAVALLASSQLTVSDIAEQTGFNSQAYFSKMFKQQFKCTPSEYRQSL